jgi:hypothetical protein
MWKPQASVTLTPGVEEAPMAGRMRLPKSVLGLAAGAVVLVALGSPVSRASSENQALTGTRAFHGTKDCSGSTGLAGGFCTFRSSNVKAIRLGSKIFYFQSASKTALDSDMVVYVKRGSVATGHCLLRFATGVGLCTISDGTGVLAGFHARVRVSADSSIPNLWHWDGTYGFDQS